jgi:hypothetical protein
VRRSVVRCVDDDDDVVVVALVVVISCHLRRCLQRPARQEPFPVPRSHCESHAGPASFDSGAFSCNHAVLDVRTASLFLTFVLQEIPGKLTASLSATLSE